MNSEVVRLLSEGERFALFCHTSPDGDTFGSAMALALALEQMGKSVQIFCQTGVPWRLRDLPLRDRVRTEGTMEPGFTAVAIDCADEERMGTMAALYRTGAHFLNIDHHVTNTRYGEVNLVDPTAAAAGEIIWDLIKELPVTPDPQMALCAFIAVSTDTGCFMYSNTSARTFRVASELFAQKFDHSDVCSRLFREMSLSSAKMTGICMDNMRLLAGGKIAVSSVSLEEMRASGTTTEDADGMSEKLRDIDTVQASAFLREQEPGVFKASLRAKGSADVSAVAKQFAGGGHVCAAGCTLHDDRETALAKISAALLAALGEE